jgi:replicative DNA helicase
MADKKFDIQEIVYSPERSAELAVKMVEELQNTKDFGLKTGLVDVDKVLIPLRPGWLVTILGYTGNLKSTWMDWLGIQALSTIKPETPGVVIKVTWEQPVEEDTLSWIAAKGGLSVTKMARGQVDEPEWIILRGTAVQRAATPLWVVGHSQQEYELHRQARPRMTMRDVARAMEYIIHDSTPGITLAPKMVILDYLQRMRHDPQDGDTRREQMMESVNLSKDLAISYGCPVVLGVQTGRESEKRIPSLQDGQETSNIEQSSDISFGCWYPIKSGADVGSMIDGKFKVTKNLFILRLLKQKLGPAPETWALRVDPERRTFGNMTKEELPTQRKVYGQNE